MADLPRSFRYRKVFLLSVSAAQKQEASHNPEYTTLAGLTYIRFGLIRVRSPLLAESQLMSIPRGT